MRIVSSGEFSIVSGCRGYFLGAFRAISFCSPLVSSLLIRDDNTAFF